MRIEGTRRERDGRVRRVDVEAKGAKGGVEKVGLEVETPTIGTAAVRTGVDLLAMRGRRQRVVLEGFGDDTLERLHVLTHVPVAP